MIITRTSGLTGVEHTMDLPTVTQERLDRCWQFNANREGDHIQVVFPDLTADEREFLVTGSTAQEWEDAFGGEDDE